MKIKKLLQLVSGFVLSLSSLLTISVPLAHAAGFTCTWTGNGLNGNFSNSANWDTTTAGVNCNGAAPVPGDADNLVFPFTLTSSQPTAFAPHNDLTAATFQTITFNGAVDTNGDIYQIDGNSFSIVSGINNNGTGTGAVVLFNNDITNNSPSTFNNQLATNFTALEGHLSGTGTITQTGAGNLNLDADNSSLSGAITVNGGRLFAGDPKALGTGGATINNGADFTLGSNACGNASLDGNLTLTGNSALTTGDFPNPKLGSNSGCSFSGSVGAVEEYGAQSDSGTATFNGTITLGSDVTFAGTASTTTISGPLTGAHSITMLPGYTGKLVIASSNNTATTANGTYTSAQFTKTLSDNLPGTDADIWGNNLITIDGQRGSVTVNDGGILKGHGTLGLLDVDAQSTVAPGNSPGCLTTGGLTLAGTYQAEIGGTTPCSGYDQIIVSSGGSVDVTGATLAVSSYGGFVPAVGQSFTIISNGGSNPVAGTFSGLAQGANFTSGGITYSISYTGGDGNDVVLTVTGNGGQTPTKPNTGLQLSAAHAGLTFGLTSLAAAGLIIASRRLKPVHKR